MAAFISIVGADGGRNTSGIVACVVVPLAESMPTVIFGRPFYSRINANVVLDKHLLIITITTTTM